MRSSLIFVWGFCIIAFLADNGADCYSERYRTLYNIVMEGVLTVELKNRDSFPPSINAPHPELAGILHNDLRKIPKNLRNYEEEYYFPSGGDIVEKTDVELRPNENHRFFNWLINMISNKEWLQKLPVFHRPKAPDIVTPQVPSPTTTTVAATTTTTVAPTSTSVTTEVPPSTTIKSSTPLGKKKKKKKHKKPRNPSKEKLISVDYSPDGN